MGTRYEQHSGEPDEADLADLIERRFLGVDPDSQDMVLEDADWLMIIQALRAKG